MSGASKLHLRFQTNTRIACIQNSAMITFAEYHCGTRRRTQGEREVQIRALLFGSCAILASIHGDASGAFRDNRGVGGAWLGVYG